MVWFRDKLAAGKNQVTNVATKFVAGNEDGASAVEYALLVGLIAVVIIGSVTTLGTQVQAKFDAIVTALGS